MSTTSHPSDPSTKPLLVHFRKQSNRFGIRRDQLREMAQLLGRTETTVAHIAMARMHMQLFPQQYQDDGGTPAQSSLSDDPAALLPGQEGMQTIGDWLTATTQPSP